MRKQLTVILLSALMLSGCASGRMGNPGAIVGGAAIGGKRAGTDDCADLTKTHHLKAALQFAIMNRFLAIIKALCSRQS